MSEYQLPPMEDYESSQFAWMGLSNMRSSLSAEQEIAIRRHIEEQAEEIATLKAALNAQSEALAEAKKLIREVADNDVSIFKNMSDAIRLVASWDSAVAATTEDAPKQEVTLTDAEIEWLAKHRYESRAIKSVFRLSKLEPFDPAIPMCIRLDYANDRYYYYVLAQEKDTPANRAAIEARRNKESE